MQVGFAGLLTIVLIVLKLTEVIAWSWLWVLFPLWIGFALLILLLVIFPFIALGFTALMLQITKINHKQDSNSFNDTI